VIRRSSEGCLYVCTNGNTANAYRRRPPPAHISGAALKMACSGVLQWGLFFSSLRVITRWPTLPPVRCRVWRAKSGKLVHPSCLRHPNWNIRVSAMQIPAYQPGQPLAAVGVGIPPPSLFLVPVCFPIRTSKRFTAVKRCTASRLRPAWGPPRGPLSQPYRESLAASGERYLSIATSSNNRAFDGNAFSGGAVLVR
jgi:hypothetical protein